MRFFVPSTSKASPAISLNEYADLLAASVGKAPVPAGYGEATLFQDPEWFASGSNCCWKNMGRSSGTTSRRKRSFAIGHHIPCHPEARGILGGAVCHSRFISSGVRPHAALAQIAERLYHPLVERARMFFLVFGGGNCDPCRSGVQERLSIRLWLTRIALRMTSVEFQNLANVRVQDGVLTLDRVWYNRREGRNNIVASV
jgi:hypothetical protein